MILKVKKILETNDLPYTFHSKDDNIPFDRIDVPIIIEDYPENLPNKIEIMFVPGMEDATQGLSLLQFYTILNLRINEKKAVQVDLMRLMSDINYTLAAGAFILIFRKNIYI